MDTIIRIANNKNLDLLTIMIAAILYWLFIFILF